MADNQKVELLLSPDAQGQINTISSQHGIQPLALAQIAMSVGLEAISKDPAVLGEAVRRSFRR